MVLLWFKPYVLQTKHTLKAMPKLKKSSVRHFKPMLYILVKIIIAFQV